MKLPLQKRESDRLEFKAAAALARPASIGREVVAFLNSEKGGKVWIGVRESEGIAVAAEPIPDVAREADRLFDHLVDTIEPPLRDEVRVDLVDGVICISVDPIAIKRPYAQIKQNGRYYYLRIGSRIRAMTREELATQFRAVTQEELATQFTHGKDQNDTELLKAMSDVIEARDKAIETHRGLFVRIQPTFDAELELDTLEPLLRDPRLSSNRENGWNFTSQYEVINTRQGRIELGGPEGYLHTIVYRSGALELRTPLEYLHWKGEANEIWPLTLIEYPTSLLRLAAKLFDKFQEGRVVFDIALFSIRGWILKPGSPEDYWSPPKQDPYKEDNITLLKPLVFELQKIQREPDRCSYRVIVEIYEAFGHNASAIPKVFDPVAGRLLITE